jgi:hypothetical protein
VVTINEVEDLLALGHEIRSFEVKGPGEVSDKAFVSRVARAAMAMGNLRDGGIVCVGIDNKRLKSMLPGLNSSQFAQWSDFDNVSTALERYSDPPVTFELQPLTLTNNANVVVLEVAEFDHAPHVCKREYSGTLQDGQTYVRPRGQPRSVPVPSSIEMRELLDLAVDKGVREFIRRASVAGLPPGTVTSQEDLDRAAYEKERDLAWPPGGAVGDEKAGRTFLTSRGYTDIAIRPNPYDPERIRPDRMESFLVERVVRLRGWPVPMVDQRLPIQRHGRWIAQEISDGIMPHEEAWRLFTSAHFLHRRVLATDLSDSPDLRPLHPDATGAVAVGDALLYMIEVAELGARWATAVQCDSITFDVNLDNIRGRELVAGERRRHLPGGGPYIVATNRITATETIEVADLLSDTRRIGVRLGQKLLRQFGVDLREQILFDYQENTLSQ